VLTSFLLIFSGALLLALVSTKYVRDLAHRKGWLETPVLDRHVHTTPLPRIGGVAIVSSFTIAIGCFLLAAHWFNLPFADLTIPTLKMLGPAFMVFLLGLYDDLRGASPTAKFLVQAIAAALLYMGGFGIHRFDLFFSGQPLQTIVGLPLTIFWVLLISNAFNLIDGLDGLAAGSALFSTTIIFILSFIVPNVMVSFLSLALTGVILGFLRYNFSPASIFLGDSGSLFIGFVISALAMAGSQKSPTIVAVTIPLVSLGFPILDVLLDFGRRFLRGKPLFEGDRDHIHHKLLKRGLSQREAVLLLYAVTAGFGFVSLVLLHQMTPVALILALTGTAVLIGVQQLRYNEFGEMLSILQRATRRRQVIANHVAVRRATEILESCDEFQSICQVLQDTLRPVGFDGIRFQMMHPNGYAASSFYPLNYEPDGKLILTWLDRGMEDPPWELRLELVSNAAERWGYLSLVRALDSKPIALDLNVLSGEFRRSLSRAVKRACDRMDAVAGAEEESHAHDAHKSAAGSKAG
jgi:UDP-GlcNAc:undecaprenyl-phosphate/decaprenyl-phosphate GlcNAc-1-phosphate transferase